MDGWLVLRVREVGGSVDIDIGIHVHALFFLYVCRVRACRDTIVEIGPEWQDGICVILSIHNTFA